MDSIKVVPAAGLQIRDPINRMMLPAEGIVVSGQDYSAIAYWQRRARERSVTITKVKGEQKTPPPHKE